MNDDQNKDNYEGAGYNGFLRRTLNSNPNERTLRQVGPMRAYKPMEINLDTTPTSGSLGSTLRVGSGVEISGPEERVSIINAEGNEVARFGRVNE